MRVFGAMMLVGVAAMMVAGCNDARTQVPPLESTDVSATGPDKSGPVIVEPGTPGPIARPKTGPTPGPLAKTYTVQKGDGLMAIARTVYGDPSMYKKIYEANKDKVGPAPGYELKPGTVLTLPPK